VAIRKYTNIVTSALIIVPELKTTNTHMRDVTETSQVSGGELNEFLHPESTAVEFGFFTQDPIRTV
jgi:hypothetical protein